MIRIWKRLKSTLNIQQTESLLEACVKKNDIPGSLLQYNQVISSGIKPTQGMMFRLLELAANNSSIDAAEKIWESYQFLGYQPNLDFYYLMMKTYATQNNIPFAWKMFKDLKSLGMELDVRIYNAALRAFICKANEIELNEFYKEMVTKVEPNEETFMLLIEYHVRHKDMEKVMFWYHLMQGTTKVEAFPVPKRIEPTDLTNETVFRGYVQICRFVLGIPFVKRLIEQGKAGPLVYETAIIKMALFLRKHYVLELLGLAKANNINLSPRVYMNIAKMYYRLLDFETGNEWCKQIEFMGYEVDRTVYSAMVRAFLAQRKYRKAYQITQQCLESGRTNISILTDMACLLDDIKCINLDHDLTPTEVEDMLEQIWKAFQPFRKAHVPRPIRIYKSFLDHYITTNQVDKAQQIMDALLDDFMYVPIETGLEFGRLVVKAKGWEALFSLWPNHVKRKTQIEFKVWLNSGGIKSLPSLTMDMFSPYARGYPIRLLDQRRELYLVEVQFSTYLSIFQETVPNATQRIFIKRYDDVPCMKKSIVFEDSLRAIWKEVSESEFEQKDEFAKVLIRMCEMKRYFKTRAFILSHANYLTRNKLV